MRPLNFFSGFFLKLWSEWSANTRAVFLLIMLSFATSLTITTFGDAIGNITIANFGVHTATVCKLLAIAFIFAEGGIKDSKLRAVSRLLFGLSLVYAVSAIAHLFEMFPWFDAVTIIARNLWVTIFILIFIYIVVAYLNGVFSGKTDSEIQDDKYNQP